MKYLNKKALCLCGFLFGTIGLFAQTTIVDNSFNTWWSNINSYTLTDKLFLSSELHLRRTDGLKTQQQFLLRPALNYRMNKQVEFTVGYTYISSHPYGKQPIAIITPENNFWEQVTLYSKSEKVKFIHRYRMEHRYIGNVATNENGELQIDGSNYAQRFRYRITSVIPLAKEGKYFAAWFDEIWINLADNFMPLSLNQNWIYGGLGYQFSKKGNIQLGYMHQLIRKGDGIHYESNPTTQLTVIYNFSKQEKE